MERVFRDFIEVVEVEVKDVEVVEPQLEVVEVVVVVTWLHSHFERVSQ